MEVNKPRCLNCYFKKMLTAVMKITALGHNGALTFHTFFLLLFLLLITTTEIIMIIQKANGHNHNKDGSAFCEATDIKFKL